jgi:hypothetical protein
MWFIINKTRKIKKSCLHEETKALACASKVEETTNTGLGWCFISVASLHYRVQILCSCDPACCGAVKVTARARPQQNLGWVLSGGRRSTKPSRPQRASIWSSRIGGTRSRVCTRSDTRAARVLRRRSVRPCAALLQYWIMISQGLFGSCLYLSQALFRCTLKPKNLQDFQSHRILRYMHKILNIYKKITNCTVCL